MGRFSSGNAFSLAITHEHTHDVAHRCRFQFVTATQRIRRRAETVSTKERSNKGVESMKALMAIAFATLIIATAGIAQQPAQPPMHPHPPNAPADQNAPQAPQMPQPPPPQDPLAHLMFPPDMILNHARQLNLTEDQKAFMRSEVQKATVAFQDLQWKLQDQTELLHETMKSTSVNEQQALAQLDKVLEIEREIKRLHIGLAVRLKNRLTPEQQEQLHNMRMDHHPGMPEGPDRPPEPIQ